jgi:uncharacterized UPF0160 family protein
MSRDFTPKETYMADKELQLTKGEGIRNIRFAWNTATLERKKVEKDFADFAFLYGDFHKMFSKYSELNEERNLLFGYIESCINLTANNEKLEKENIISQIEKFYEKNPSYKHPKGLDYVKEKTDVLLTAMPSETIEKWFDGKLTNNFYYNTENDELFANAIDKAMCDIVKDKCKEFAKGSTHSTIFHADETFTTALFLTLNPSFTYERSLDIPDDPSIIVYDKGMGKYDHHQKDNEVRENGVPYASFGKVWRDFSKYLMIDDRLMTKSEREVVERKLVQVIDSSDNGKGRDDYSGYISLLNPINRPEKTNVEESNEMFKQAVTFAKSALGRHMDLSVEFGRQKELLTESLKDAKDGVLYLKGHISAKDPMMHEILVENNIDLIIYPSLRGGYNVQQIPISQENLAGRLPFPEQWLGKPAKDLPEHITFCHPGNWLLAIDNEIPKEAMEMGLKIANTCREELKKSIGREFDETLK